MSFDQWPFLVSLVNRVRIRYCGISLFLSHFMVPHAGLWLLLANALLFGSLRSASGDLPKDQADSPQSSRPASADFNTAQKEAIVFDETEFLDIREGYLELSWSKAAGAAMYSVSDSSDSVFYRGAFPKAFISGLSSGEYEFTVAALDANERVIAVCKEPARVTVKHWPLYQAWVSFGVGLVVFCAVVFVIARGAITASDLESATRKQADSAGAQNASGVGSRAIDSSEGEA